jgi:hypothetical protein
MLPMSNLIARSQTASWAEVEQVEPDLIISRAASEILSDPAMGNQLLFRGECSAPSKSLSAREVLWLLSALYAS